MVKPPRRDRRFRSDRRRASPSESMRRAFLERRPDPVRWRAVRVQPDRGRGTRVPAGWQPCRL